MFQCTCKKLIFDKLVLGKSRLVKNRRHLKRLTWRKLIFEQDDCWKVEIWKDRLMFSWILWKLIFEKWELEKYVVGTVDIERVDMGETGIWRLVFVKLICQGWHMLGGHMTSWYLRNRCWNQWSWDHRYLKKLMWEKLIFEQVDFLKSCYFEKVDICFSGHVEVDIRETGIGTNR